MAKPESSESKTKVPLPAAPMRAPKHGNGMLRVGNPRVGRTNAPMIVRQACRLAFHESVPMLTEIMNKKDEAGNYVHDASDRTRAADVLAKYGLGPPRAVDLDDVKMRVGETWELLSAHLSQKEAQAVLEQYKAIWSR